MGLPDWESDLSLRGYPEDEENLVWQDDTAKDDPDFTDADDLDDDLDDEEAEPDVEDKELDWAISQEEREDDWD
jgi:hypothetical protein